MMSNDHQGISFQILSCRISISYDDPRLRSTLDYIAVEAVQDVTITKTLSYTVAGTGPYEIREENDFLDRVGSADDVLFRIYRRVYRRVLDRYVLAGWVVLHAGAVKVNGSRLAILGDKGAGKTTLMTRLMCAGHQLEGDELLLARGDQLLAVPRRLHLKPDIESNVPQLAGQLDDLPVTRAGDTKIRALDPVLHGFDWQISVGAVDHWIWLSPNHGGNTRLDKMTSFIMMQRMLESYLGWGESRRQVVNCVAGLATKGGFRLLLGNADEAAMQLQTLAARGH